MPSMVNMDVSRNWKTATPQVAPLHLKEFVVKRTNTVYAGHSPICRCNTHVRPSNQQNRHVFTLAVGDRSSSDLRRTSHASFPPHYYQKYICNPEVLGKIGAETTCQDHSHSCFDRFEKTGDVCLCLIGISRRLTVLDACSIGCTNVAPSAL